MSQDTQSSPRATFSALAIRLASVWVLAGAGFKLFAGTPADLPSLIRDLPLELGLTYNLAIGIELCIALLAILRPRWAWMPLALLFLTFDAILVTMLGDASCGCFGSKITLSPALMLGIDSTLLLSILVSRPWQSLRSSGLGLAWIAPVMGIAIALPWILDRQVPGGANDAGTVTQNGIPVEGAWLELDVTNWVDKDIHDTPLAKYVELDSLVLDGLVVLYRDSCDHCATHLAKLASEEVGERMITLIRLKERSDTEANRVVHLLPEGGFVQKASLPDSITYILTTPAELELENGRIVAGREGV